MRSKTRSLLRHLLPLTLTSGLLAGCFDSTVPGDYYPGLSDNSPPPDPSTYAVAGDVSGTLGAVTVNKIGGLNAAQISQGLGSIATATDANSPSTIVSRDSAGSFLANVITATNFNGTLNGTSTSSGSSAYAEGRQGADISSFGTLGFGGGQIFRVTAAGTMNQSGFPPGMPSGTTVTLLFTGGPVTVVHAVSTPTLPGLLLRGAGNFRTANLGTDSLTLVFVSGAPQGNWIEIDRHVAPSEVIARSTLGQAIPDGLEQTLNFDFEERDTRNEFGAGTFIPTSTQTTYQFNAQFTTDAFTWGVGDYCQVRIYNGASLRFSSIQHPTPGQNSSCSVPISGIIRLGVGASITATATVAHAGGTTIAADGTLTYLTLNRIDQP